MTSLVGQFGCRFKNGSDQEGRSRRDQWEETPDRAGATTVCACLASPGRLLIYEDQRSCCSQNRLASKALAGAAAMPRTDTVINNAISVFMTTSKLPNRRPTIIGLGSKLGGSVTEGCARKHRSRAPSQGRMMTCWV